MISEAISKWNKLEMEMDEKWQEIGGMLLQR